MITFASFLDLRLSGNSLSLLKTGCADLINPSAVGSTQQEVLDV